MNGDDNPVVVILTPRQAALVALALGHAAINYDVTPEEALAITEILQRAMGASAP